MSFTTAKVTLTDIIFKDEVVDQTCSGVCNLEQFDDLLLTRFEDSLDVSVANGDITQQVATNAR